MKIAEGVHLLELRGQMGDRLTILNLTLLTGPEGPTLIDTGYPGQLEALIEALRQEGVRPEELRRIVLTHQDIDHIGNLKALKEMSGAQVLAHRIEAPYIEGKEPLVKMTPSRLAGMPEAMRKQIEGFLASLRELRVDELLEDSDRLPGGVLVLHTPGHTPGHISLFLEAQKVLVAGDELNVVEGVLQGPRPEVTLDMEAAHASLNKLAQLDVDQVIAYHGGLYGPRAKARIAELASWRG
jgi:glyoxylase-like metal-dependent hydrolase (beta-lactamase superfamily II)